MMMASLLSSFLDPATADALETSQSISPMEVIENTGPGLLTRSLCRWLVGNSSQSPDSALGRSCRDSTGKTTTSFDVSQVMVFPSRAFHPFPNHLRKAMLSVGGDAPTDERDICFAPNIGQRDMLEIGSSVRTLSMLEAFIVPGETKAIHLWGCSWQGS
mmetsp:Transcript_35004/g.75594  ORF Transcript_35004/g.75594 Transcript_35004/m.75594 type:complete len:159 (-) Transcript_35004:221-697(-)